MRALLQYANFTHVAVGLTEAGYPVSFATVSRWAKGTNVTPRAVKLVEDLLGTTKEPRPEWAEALQESVGAIQRTVESNAKNLGAVLAILGASQSPTGRFPDDPQDAPRPVRPADKRGR